MSHRLEELKGWDGLYEYIEQYPNLPSGHSAIKAALHAVREDRSERQAKIRKDFALELAWERLIANDQQPLNSTGLPQLKLKSSELTKKAVEKLLEWAHQCRAPYRLELTFPEDRDDLEKDAVPLFVGFLKASQVKELVFNAQMGGRGRWTEYVTSVEGLGMHDVPDHLDLNYEARRPNPQWYRILSSPKCKVSKISGCWPKASEVVDMLGFVGTQHLEEFRVCSEYGSFFQNDSINFDSLIVALKRSRELQVFDFDGFVEEPIEASLERLLEEHALLRSVTIHSNYRQIKDLSWANESFHKSVCSHDNLQELVLPMGEHFVPLALPLMRHCSDPNTSLTYLKLGKSVEMMPVGDPRVSWTHALGFGQLDSTTIVADDSALILDTSRKKFLVGYLRVSEIPNVLQICLFDNMGWTEQEYKECFARLFTEPTNISGFAILWTALKEELMACWLDSVRMYTKLRRVRLDFSMKVPFQSFCPASCLQIAALGIKGTVSCAVQAMAVLLLEQQGLQTLEVLVREGDEEHAEHETGAGHLSLFAGALQRHPSLKTLVFSVGQRQTQELRIFSTMFAALQENQVLKKLHLSAVDYNRYQDVILQHLPKLELSSLEELKFLVWHDVLSDHEQQRMITALKPNMSLCSLICVHLGERYRARPHAPLGRAVEAILKRNRLLHDHARKAGDNVCSSLSPYLFAKMGSVERESSPLFVAIRNSILALVSPVACLAGTKKRKGV